jgi:putative endonuclease
MAPLNKSSNCDKGSLGESVARWFLIKKGYQIVDRNKKYLDSELDIVSLKDNVLVFVEVKYRMVGVYTDIYSSIGGLKLHRLKKGILHYLSNISLKFNDIRLDAIFVQHKESKFLVEHYVDILS